MIRKRLFIALISGSLLFLLSLAAGVWYVVTHREIFLNKLVVTGFGVFFALLSLLVGLGIVGIVLTIWKAKDFPALQRLMRMAVNILYPIAVFLGKIVGIEKDVIRNSFIQVMNQLVRTRKIVVEPERILILTPHCLQKSHCPHKITLDVRNCARCGACAIDGLIGLSEKYGVHVVVASGGTFARKFIADLGPKAIVAVACERDLTSGIQDVPNIPVIGVVNDRPEGPCYNTRVDLNRVEEAILFFMTGERYTYDANNHLVVQQLGVH